VNPYWLGEPSPVRPETKLVGRADVAIVGAGVTGCSAALRLAEAGLRVRVHDAREIAAGASGRNGGFALGGGAARYDVARETYGAERAAAFWRWTHEALDQIAVLAGDALRRPGSYRLAGDEEEREGVRLEYEALREDGFDAEWLEDVPGSAAGRFHGAISHPHDGSIQPARFVRRLATAATGAGTVEDLEALEADRVLVATDGYGHGLIPELADLVWPTRGQVIASEPLARVLYDRPHYARQGFDYWQQLPDGRILLGGFRDVSILDELTDVEETTPAIQSSLESFLHELVGEQVPVTHRWAGIFGTDAGHAAARRGGSGP
jgi:gamma-glutamylputrescine oxidase